MKPSESEKLVQAFNESGFATMANFLSSAELSELESNVHRFIRTIVPGLPAEHVFLEDKSDTASLKQIQQMGEYDGFFHELLHGHLIRRVAETWLNDDVIPKNLQYFNKPPQIGKPTPAHQDGYYFMLEPCEAMTFWLALDVADERNGCVRYVRGSHRNGMRHHSRTATLGFSQGISDYGEADAAAEVVAHASPGDLLGHHAMTIHRADGNQSKDRHRRALGFIYYAARAKHDELAHERYQRQLAKDMQAAGVI